MGTTCWDNTDQADLLYSGPWMNILCIFEIKMSAVKVSKVSVYLLRNRQQSINEHDGLGELGLMGPWVMKMIRRAAGR